MPKENAPGSDSAVSKESLEVARQTLAEAHRVLILTGAGISVASGMPTFRGEDGLWKDHRPEELATPQAFRRDPVTVWEWYAWRRRKARECEPNQAHRALARWCLAREDVTLVSQNVDGLHGRALRSVAGRRPPEHAEPVELHGSLFRARCTGCGWRGRLEGDVDATDRSTLPRCQDCGGLLRPDVVWFGESLDPACLVVGTSAAVQPAASLATEAAGAGATLIEVNPEETPVSRVAAVSLRSDAARAVPDLLRPLLDRPRDAGSEASGEAAG